MRTPRLKLESLAVYHCTSRILDDRPLLDHACKDFLLKNLYKWADFCGVQLLAFCIMDDHYHVLAKVDPAEKPSQEEVDRRFRLVNSHLPQKLLNWKNALRTHDKATIQAAATRMGDISQFLKELKQAVTPWINAHNNRRGPLWIHRFTSLVIEQKPEILHTLATYIDLNPIRAGLTDNPTTYPWCTAGTNPETEHRDTLQQHLDEPTSPLKNRIPAFTLGTILGTPSFILQTKDNISDRYKLRKRQYTIPIEGLDAKLFTSYSNPRTLNQE